MISLEQLTVHFRGLTVGMLGILSEAELSSVSPLAAPSWGEGDVELSAPDMAESSPPSPVPQSLPFFSGDLLNFLHKIYKKYLVKKSSDRRNKKS